MVTPEGLQYGAFGALMLVLISVGGAAWKYFDRMNGQIDANETYMRDLMQQDREDRAEHQRQLQELTARSIEIAVASTAAINGSTETMKQLCQKSDLREIEQHHGHRELLDGHRRILEVLASE